VLVDQLVELHKQINKMEAAMVRRCRSEPDAARLLTVPGVGPITACAILAGVPDMKGFRSGRDLARPRSATELDRRQNQAGQHHQDG
jgi:transposase